MYGVNLGLIDQIDSCMFHNMQYYPVKTNLTPDKPEYAHRWDSHYKYLFSQTDWEEVFKSGIIPLDDDEIKNNIISMLDSSIDATNAWLDTYIEVRSLFIYFLESNNYELLPIIEEYYKFFVQELSKRPIVIPSWAQQEPREKLAEREQIIRNVESLRQMREEDIARRYCPNCGAKGSNIVKWGPQRFMCNVCGKTFPKPRKA